MAGTFTRRVQDLIDRHSGGALRGEVIVDQVYAKYQHENLSLRHPAGGGPKYLWNAVIFDLPRTMRELAKEALWVDPGITMTKAVERWSGGVFDRAPLEFGDLKASGHPRVKEGGKVIYDRPPLAKRLTESEIEAKRELRDLGFGNRAVDFDD